MDGWQFGWTRRQNCSLQFAVTNVMNELLFGYAYEMDDERATRMFALVRENESITADPLVFLSTMAPVLPYLPPWKGGRADDDADGT